MRRFLDTITATHVTVMFGIAVCVPSALFAAAAFTSVVIQDPSSPSLQARVDAHGRLSVIDQFADYGAIPNRLVRININGGSCAPGYTVPAGSALIITSAIAVLYKQTSSDTTSIDLYAGTSTKPCSSYIGTASSSQVSETVSLRFGNGVAVPSGAVLSNDARKLGIGGVTFYGYFVPAALVPPLGSAEAAEQAVVVRK